ncbi:SMI1/KNR4 family protein [Mucilaginibacter sp.]|uniref:SMI1/KNR4 family protein n=1 Tax=Mucilaginibacter sp. TaxID=1882438 RepID=UPI00262CFD35|nr:SMI1/KNR4 family protein [Mucilaginibacter sp.]MDB4923897.1 cell-wall [Mucilaginibacter sp.]
MTFHSIRTTYSGYDPAFPSKMKRPNQKDLNLIIDRYDCKFPPSFIQFQLEECQSTPMGDYAFDGFGWANSTLDPYMNLQEIVKGFRELNYPKWLTPFKTDNGDYWCFDNRSTINNEFPVVIFDHNSNNIEKESIYNWENFLDWLAGSFKDE